MEERNYRINWLGLFIKVIVFVVVVLLAIWLISKIVYRNKGLSIEENNQKFQDAVVEYFTNNLPKANGTRTVTLKQLINAKYIKNLKTTNGKKCDTSSSKATIEQIDNYYSIKSELVCENQKEVTYIKLGNEECTDCDKVVNGLKINNTTTVVENTNTSDNTSTTNTNTSTSSNSSSSVSSSNSNNNTSSSYSNSNSSSSNQTVDNTPTILYEYVKETNEYSDWYNGYVTGNNIQNSTKTISTSKYCKNEEQTYYTMSYITYKTNYTYTLELIGLNSNISNVKLNSSNYFSSLTDYQNYIDIKNSTVSMVGSANNGVTGNASTLKNASLTSSNFTFTTSDIYKKNGSYYIDLNVVIKNINNVTPTYLSSARSYVYYVPIKFTFNYTDLNNCITEQSTNEKVGYTIVDTYNETIDIYRYIITVKEYKYSNLTSLDGYTKTGNTKTVD